MTEPRWWEVRRAQSTKPATYTCPLCGELLPPMRPHVLLLPEGRPRGRRHAHEECAHGARAEGRLPLREDVEGPRPPGRLARLLRRRAPG